jgi:hypothetical protein
MPDAPDTTAKPEVGTEAFRRAMDAAVAAGVRDALARHKMRGESIVAWQDGRVVEIPASEIVIPDVPTPPALTSPKPSAA